MLGVDHNQFVGLTLEEAFPPFADTEVSTRYREAAAHGTPWYVEQVSYDHGGIAGAFEVSAFQTAPNEMAAIFLDITERTKAEEAVPALIKMLKDEDGDVRLAAAEVLGRTGPQAKTTTPALIEVLLY